MRILDIPLIAKTRRSHALEHATIELLNRRYPALRLAGRSVPDGFYIYGQMPAQDVQAAAEEAIARLGNGASHLAVSARCGTNLVTAGLLAGLVSFLAMLPGSDRSRRERLPLILLLVTLSLLLAQPLGPLVQQYITTEANVRNTTVVHVTESSLRRIPVRYVQLDHHIAAGA